MPERSRASSAHISPSAHYTGYVWYRHRLAEPAFVTAFGRFVHKLLWPVTWGARVGFGLDIDLHISLPGLAQDDAQSLVDAAHQVCPYSNATRGNVDVRLHVTV